MKKVQVSFFEISEKWQIDLIKAGLSASKFAVSITSAKLTAANVKRFSKSEIISVFIHSHIDEKILNQLPHLKFIATNTTGFDHIDLKACAAKKIIVSNVPHYGENTVAEHTFALLLAISRKIVESVDRTRRGKFTLAGLRGFDLKGKTIGIVGTGSIGRHVIRMAHGFEMKILAYDKFPDKTLESHYPLRYVSLENLFRNSDVVSLHAPYTRETHHLVNSKNIGLFKKGSVLINTARGGLVETAALLRALRSGRLAGAGLDVLEEEMVISEESELLSRYITRENLAVVLEDHHLLARENVLVTPHNAFNSHEAVHRIITTAIENILAWRSGRPINLVK